MGGYVAGRQAFPNSLQVRNLEKIESMKLVRITSKGQMMIPKRVREAAHLAAGDMVAFVTVSLRKITPGDDDYLRAVQGTLGEWNSPEDEEAWRGL